MDDTGTTRALSDDTTAPDIGAMTRIFGRIGLLSFGGPAAQIALMHRELVEQHRWLSEAQYLRALSFCMLLPGPEAMQLATYAGWRLRGVAGGLLAGLLFVLPGAVVVLALSAIYVTFGNVALVESLFLGVKATVVVIVLQALKRLSGKALKGAPHVAIAILSFLAIFVVGLPFPLIIATAALYGFCTSDGSVSQVPLPHPPKTLRTIATWGAIWLLPLAALGLLAPSPLPQIAVFFSKLAVVTFGGAYAVLAYMTQAAVAEHGWLTTQQMMDGLGLAETTPGPLILVTEFVGFLAAYPMGWGMALAGALVALWATFAPCFLWIFAGAPYIDRLAAQPRLSSALTAVTAAVVGVIANLSLWFAAHVFFAQIGSATVGPITVIAPAMHSIQWGVVALTVCAGALLLWRRIALLPVLAVMAALGAIMGALI